MRVYSLKRRFSGGLDARDFPDRIEGQSVICVVKCSFEARNLPTILACVLRGKHFVIRSNGNNFLCGFDARSCLLFMGYLLARCMAHLT